MKIHEVIVESSIEELAPYRMIRRGIDAVAKKLPGSIGYKAAGRSEMGAVANQLYKEYFTWLGKTGQQMTDDSLRAYLKSRGVDDQLINQEFKKNIQGPGV